MLTLLNMENEVMKSLLIYIDVSASVAVVVPVNSATVLNLIEKSRVIFVIFY